MVDDPSPKTVQSQAAVTSGPTVIDPPEYSNDGSLVTAPWVYDLDAPSNNESSKPVDGFVIRSLRWCARLVANLVAGLFGFVSIVFLLSILATIPVLQFLSLGYLIEAGARVFRSGRLRDGFIGIAGFRRVAGVLVASYLLLLPIRLLADVRNSAALLEADSGRTAILTIATWLTAVAVLFHISWAIHRGGRMRSFVWPAPLYFLRTLRKHGFGGMYIDARDRLWSHCISLQLPYYLGLGVRGFVIAIAWLAVPISILVFASRLGEAASFLLSAFGGILLLTVLLFLPFQQLNFARHQRFMDGFRVRLVRQQFRKAPIAFGISLIATLVLAVPLYLLKAEFIPREAAWLPSLVFVLSIFPTRLLTGWALRRAESQVEDRIWISIWLTRVTVLPVVAAYVLVVYLTQYTSWYGVWSLYEQHAFLLPIPFIGL